MSKIKTFGQAHTSSLTASSTQDTHAFAIVQNAKLELIWQLDFHIGSYWSHKCCNISADRTQGHLAPNKNKNLTIRVIRRPKPAVYTLSWHKLDVNWGRIPQM
jgi:hypothetical protein